MPRTPAAAYAWARDEARAHRIRRDWAGMCEAAVNWAFDYRAFPTALAAGNASGLLRPDYANAPVGANIYWSGVWVDGVECGHIATVYEQGPDPIVFMASSAVTDNWGGNLGTIRLSAYQRRFGHKLRGWSLNHGSQQPNMSGSASAGGGPAPVPTITEDEEEDMLFIRSKGNGAAGFARNGYIYRRVEGSWFAVQNLEGETLVPALVAKGAVLAEFNAVDLEIMFATDGIWEQSIIPAGNVWGPGRIPLQGLGYRTGRRCFPGAPGTLGQWHFPAQLK